MIADCDPLFHAAVLYGNRCANSVITSPLNCVKFESVLIEKHFLRRKWTKTALSIIEFRAEWLFVVVVVVYFIY